MHDSSLPLHGVGRDRTTAARQFRWSDQLAALRYVPRLLTLIWKISPPLTAAALGSRALRAGLPLAGVWLSKLLIDGIVQYVQQGHGSSSYIWTLVGLEIATVIAGETLSRVNVLYESRLADRFTTQVGVNIIKHASTLDLASCQTASFYDSLERAQSHNSSRMALIASLFNLGQNLSTFILLSTVLSIHSPWLVAFLLAAFVPPLLGEGQLSNLTYSSLFHWTPYRRFLNYVSYLAISADTIKEIKLCGLSDHLATLYSSVADNIYQDTTRLGLKRAVIGTALSILCTASYYGAYALVLLPTLAGALSLGTFIFLTSSFSRSKNAIEKLIGDITGIAEQAVYLKDLFTFLDTRSTLAARPNGKRVPRPPLHGFEFRNVSFTYPGASRPVLNDVTFHLPPGRVLALVGENGAGKTTLVKLLLRLYDPTAGTILLDGIDLRDYDLADVYSSAGILFQDYVRYHLLVRDNIAFGRIEAQHDISRIERAAANSGASEMVSRQPRGFNQMLGHQFEDGVSLSGGEWQKLALARAYMRDSQLLILDEPTAALDPQAEHDLMQGFRTLVEGRMIVLISHRLSAVRMADTILVLRNGTICESGHHDSLMKRRQHYAELFHIQAAAYRSAEEGARKRQRRKRSSRDKPD